MEGANCGFDSCERCVSENCFYVATIWRVCICLFSADAIYADEIQALVRPKHYCGNFSQFFCTSYPNETTSTISPSPSDDELNEYVVATESLGSLLGIGVAGFVIYLLRKYFVRAFHWVRGPLQRLRIWLCNYHIGEILQRVGSYITLGGDDDENSDDDEENANEEGGGAAAEGNAGNAGNIGYEVNESGSGGNDGGQGEECHNNQDDISTEPTSQVDGDEDSDDNQEAGSGDVTNVEKVEKHSDDVEEEKIEEVHDCEGLNAEAGSSGACFVDLELGEGKVQEEEEEEEKDKLVKKRPSRIPTKVDILPVEEEKSELQIPSQAEVKVERLCRPNLKVTVKKGVASGKRELRPRK